MDLIKQYITQSITAASNNLRLSSQQIEIVALLKSVINKSDDLGNDLINMKKITELSTLAIRLNDIYNFLTQNQLDLIKLSDQFKDHSRYLIKDLSHMLENVTPVAFQNSLDKLYKKPGNSVEINIDLSKRNNENEPFTKHEQNTLKEKLVLDEVSEEDDIFFQNYEAAILKPIKPLDSFLKDISKNEINFEQIQIFANMMNDNARLSSKIGFEIIANMHYVIAKALNLIKTRHLMPGKEVLESIRACLIVIVAVVKGKEVDITNYLNKAEEFGNHLATIKVRE
ncbi:MAG TPA: hypothetical protein VK870_07625 [Ignavibacteriaceae bacterium]|nr:hypothetical protein [Ignavibacteriaceae bacterium]